MSAYEPEPLDADTVVELLRMSPHPEGGAYAETFRDHAGGLRGHSTAIYYLLREGEESAWHRIDAAEAWHWYAGAPLELRIAPEDGGATFLVLGNDLLRGMRPQAVVPARAWQAARSLGAWTLVGCTVAPGFDFEEFELAPEGFAPGVAFSDE